MKTTNQPKILITGGTGFIGSLIAVSLINANYQPILVDNFSNSKKTVPQQIKQLTGVSPVVYEGNLDYNLASRIFKDQPIAGVIHCAGLKAVAESVEQPLKYYRTNLISTLDLLQAMADYKVFNLIFSSSCTVYGQPSKLPITEASPTGQGLTNPYGTTKYMIEEILKDLAVAEPRFKIIALRYFNPIGAHPSGLLGENPNDRPNNLMPLICRVAGGQLASLSVFGNDYPTPDGSAVRDYIHVLDLSLGHLQAYLHLTKQTGFKAYNLGTGQGVSVLELIKTFEEVNHLSINYTISGRRPGDVASIYADPSLAQAELAWQARLSLAEACRDSWHYYQVNH